MPAGQLCLAMGERVAGTLVLVLCTQRWSAAHGVQVLWPLLASMPSAHVSHVTEPVCA